MSKKNHVRFQNSHSNSNSNISKESYVTEKAIYPLQQEENGQNVSINFHLDQVSTAVRNQQ